jgi:hypothetical protein
VITHHHHASDYGPDYGYDDRIGLSGAMVALLMVALVLIVLAVAAAWAPRHSRGSVTPIQNQPVQQQPAQPPAAPIEPDQPLLPREQAPGQSQPLPRTVPQSPR